MWELIISITLLGIVLGVPRMVIEAARPALQESEAEPGSRPPQQDAAVSGKATGERQAGRKSGDPGLAW